MKKIIWVMLLSFILMGVNVAHAEIFPSSGGGAVDFYTVATLPGSPATNDLAGVTDGDDDGDCTVGGGSAQNMCVYSGSAWVIIGDGTSASGADAITVDGAAVTDPDFASHGDIDFTNTSNTVTADINGTAEFTAKSLTINAGTIDFTAALSFTTGSHTIVSQGELRLNDSDNSAYVGFKPSPVVSSSQVWVLPGQDGSANQQLTTDGSGVLTWATASASVAYDDIGDPDADGTISFTGYTNTWTTSETGSDFFKIVNTGNFGDVSLMRIETNGNPTDGTMLEIVNTDTNVDSIIAPNFALTQPGALSAKGITDTADTATNIATGTIGTRPGGSIGDFRYNTTLGAYEFYVSAWENLYSNLDAATFLTVNTGQGANELYDMDQHVLTTSDVEFLSIDAALAPASKTIDFTNATSFIAGTTTITSAGELRFGDSDDSNYVGFESPPTVASSQIWVLPGQDGTATYQLTTNGSGVLTWATPGGNGDITDVGDCSTGACFTQTGAGNNLYFEGTVADSFELNVTCAELGDNYTWTFPDDEIASTDIMIGNGSGTFIYAPLSSEVTMDSAGAVTLADSVTVDDWTMGDFTGSTYTGSLVADTSAVFTGAALTGLGASLEGDMILSNLQGSVTDAQVPADLTIASTSDMSATSFTSSSTTYVAGSFTIQFDGSDNQVLTYDAATTGWRGEAGGSGSPGGSDTQIQFNDGGSTFAGTSHLTWDKTNAILASTGTIDFSGASTVTSSTLTATGMVVASGGTIEFNDLLTLNDIATNGVSTTEILDGTIVTADINAAAGITAAQTALTGGVGVDITTNDFTFDSTELTNLTWSAGGSSTIDFGFNVSGTDTSFTMGSGSIEFDGDVIVNGETTWTGTSYGEVFSDPCGVMPEGFMFYRGSGTVCFCNDNGDDISIFDGSSACF